MVNGRVIGGRLAFGCLLVKPRVAAFTSYRSSTLNGSSLRFLRHIYYGVGDFGGGKRRKIVLG